jgi:tripartite-type tricarboxylate transporter receptor subunit TctC
VCSLGWNLGIDAIRKLAMKRSLMSGAVCWAGAFVLAWSVGGAANAQDGVSFAGKTITMTIGFAGGGGVDLYGRTLGRHLMRHLPGQPNLVVLNQLGAGGVVAMNDWANKAEPNGLSVTIGAQSQTDPEAMIRTHAKYDTTKFNYVGGLAAYSQGLYVNKDAVARLRDKTAKPAVMGMVGSTLRSGNYQVLWGAAFLGWNVKWVRGYTRTAELRQAMERGEIDMTTFGSSRDLAYLAQSDKFTIVSQSGSVKDGKTVGRASLGNAPLISDLVKGKIKDPLAQKAFNYGEYVSQVGMWLALPPGTPANIVATYVKAFEATLNDPQYQAEFAKIDPDSPVASKAELDKLIGELAKVSPETLDFLHAELKRQGLGTAN